jgi:hypothetical protein
MEINYFLDKKQSEFDELTTDMYSEKDIDISDMALETYQQASATESSPTVNND